MVTKKRFNKKGSLALSQILILILGTIAISYAVGSSIGFVSGLTVNGEFTYNNIDFVIKGQLKIVQKNNLGVQYLYTTNNPCRTKWFWDVNGNGNWDSSEQNRFDNNLNVCMLEGFVTAANAASVPKAGEETTIGTEDPWACDIGEKKEYKCQIVCTDEIVSCECVNTGQGIGNWNCEQCQDKCDDDAQEEPSQAQDPVSAAAAGAGVGSAVGGKDGNKTEVSAENPAGEPNVGFVGGLLQDIFPKMGSGTAAAVGHIIQGLGIALALSAGVELMKEQFLQWGFSRGQIEALQTGIALTWFFAESGYGLIQAAKEGGKLAGLGGLGKGLLGVAGATAIITIIVILSRKGEQKLVTFECVPWQPATGGNRCEECNKQALPCSEYQCRSLGQGCQLLNDEESGEAVCVWVNRNDAEYPTIRPWDDALLNENYDYDPDNTISPPDKGVKVVYNGGCIPAFTPFTFGVILDEPAICKIDPVRKSSFDEMSLHMGGSSTFKYNHTQTISLPSSDSFASEGLESQSGEQSLYVRCQDSNGNSNPATFVFKYCIEEGPDTTPPVIESTDLANGMPIAFGQTSANINVYINEPAECKWSHNDQPYDNMENLMDCSGADSLLDMNSQGLFTCNAQLSGLNDGVRNRFYFRCKDQPGQTESDRNVNVESYEFEIIGTQSLAIDSISPNDTTIRESTDPVKVTLSVRTSAGYNEGEATCYYSDTGEERDYKTFLNTASYQHSHDLWLAGEAGGRSYTYYVKCIDLGGNADYETITFEVETDTTPPVIVRAYHEETYLKITTVEEATCVYDVVSCNYLFDDGLEMDTSDGLDHFTSWATDRNFYIKCEDKFGNQPLANQCSIIIKPSQV